MKEIVGTFDSGEEYVLLIPGDHVVVGLTFKDTFCLRFYFKAELNSSWLIACVWCIMCHILNIL